MNLFNRFFSKHINRVIQSIIRLVLGTLGVLDFSGCGAMYGTPSADFEMVGKVTNEKTEPLSEVEVIAADVEHDALICEKVVSITNKTGNYRVSEDLYDLWEKNGGYLFRFVGDTNLYEPFDTIILEKNCILRMKMDGTKAEPL